MKNKIKNLVIPLLLMMIINLGMHAFINYSNFGGELNPHLGILFISGLFFGPLGVAGSVIGNFLCDMIRGYSISISLVSAIISFGIAYLGYKLWYTTVQESSLVTKIRLNNTFNMFNFLGVVIGCATLYSLLTAQIAYIFYPNTLPSYVIIALRYFVNFTNFSLIFAVIGIWISRKKDFTYTPTISQRNCEKKIYDIIGYLLIGSTLIIIISEITMNLSYEINVFEVLFLTVLIYAYSTKPIKKISEITYVSIPEQVMDRFLLTTLILMTITVVIYVTDFSDEVFEFIALIAQNQYTLLILLLLDVIVIIFFIPTLLIIKYIENSVVNPLISFSKLESRIIENEKIESDDLIKLYSNYSNQDDEIGMLSRSQIDLINYNNNYIENIKRVESEKQRIETELDIAHKIQVSILPDNYIDNENILIKGYCKPAKEVGGDFYDYYELDDDNIVLVIGDASGKGVPAAIFTMLTQNSIKQHFKYEKDPSLILRDINNQICKKNMEYMFITLWLGIYNKTTHKLVFANAGHNPPLIRKDEKFTFLNMDSEIVLGVIDDYEFHKVETILDDELLLYTDGITDAQNIKQELYGEERLTDFVNHYDKNNCLIEGLINDIKEFTCDEEQFDDMTLLLLKVKK